MAGGIFPNYPFHFNVKCIIFTLLIVLGYWYFPPKNIIVLLFLLWIPYISLAWYDYSYGCVDKMQPTIIPFGRYIFLPFKPAEYKKKFRELPKSAIRSMDRADHITGWSILIILISIGVYYYYH
jgi:hypothetical protein